MRESDSERYHSTGIYREETLYYDLGYRFSDTKNSKTNLIINLDFSYYLFIVTLILEFALNINQILTIITFGIFISNKIINNNVNKFAKYWLFVIIFGHILDYIIGDNIIEPGKFIQNNLTLYVWITEITWIILFGMEALVVFQPMTPPNVDGITVHPASEEEKKNYKSLRKRIHGTEFEIMDLNQIVDFKNLSRNLINQSKIILIILIGFVSLDILIWFISGNLGGGNNIKEQYIVSGMALILFITIIAFYNQLFPPNQINESN